MDSPSGTDPLRHLGALGFLLFWLLAVSGAYLYLRFDTSAARAWDSIERLEWWFGGLLRSLHRYAADGFVVVTFAHLVREAVAGRWRAFRAFTWISGLPLVWLLYASGIVGYWLVWDARAQISALATAEWLQALGIGAEPMTRNFLGAEHVPDRLFSLFVFLHVGLPLALLAGMWIHVHRLGEPRTSPPRALAASIVAALLLLSALHPARSEAPWDPHGLPAAVDLDWFFQFVHPLMFATSPAALWAVALGITAALALLPWALRGRRLPAALVDPANCNGCGRCVVDCPYEALRLKPAGGGWIAAVTPERCAACGLCAGACPSSTPFRSADPYASGIELPDFTMQSLRAQLRERLAQRPAVLEFRCRKAAAPAGAASLELRCLGMLPPAAVEYALRRGAAEVRAVGCEGECEFRLGMDLFEARSAGTREPRLRSTVEATRTAEGTVFRLRPRAGA